MHSPRAIRWFVFAVVLLAAFVWSFRVLHQELLPSTNAPPPTGAAADSASSRLAIPGVAKARSFNREDMVTVFARGLPAHLRKQLETDPLRAIRRALAEARSDHFQLQIAAEWALLRNPRLLPEIFAIITRSDDREFILRAVLPQLLKADREGTLALIRSLSGEGKALAFRVCIGGLVATGDMDGTNALLAEIPVSGQRDRVLSSLADRFAWGDAEPVEGWLRQLPALDRQKILSDLLWRHPFSQVQPLLKQLAAVTRDPGLREEITTILNTYVPPTILPSPAELEKTAQEKTTPPDSRKDPAGAIQAALALPRAEDQAATLFQYLRVSLDSGDLQAALAIQQQMPPSSSAGLGVTVLSPVMAKRGGDSFFAWLDQLPAGDVRNHALPSASGVFFRAGDDASLVRLLDYAPTDLSRESNLKIIGKLRMQRGDTDGIQALAGTLSEKERSYLWAGTLDTSKPPENFLADAKVIPDSFVRGNAIRSYFSNASADNPAGMAAKAWAADETSFKPAVSAVLYKWIEVDVPGAAAWLQQLPVGTRRDTAVMEFARWVRNLDLETAQKALAWIGNEELRSRFAREVK